MRVGDRVRVSDDVWDVNDWPGEGEVQFLNNVTWDERVRLHVQFDGSGLAYGFTRDQLEYVEEED